MDHPVYPATVSQPDPIFGTVTVTIGDNDPITVPWRGSAMEAVSEALDLLEQPDPALAHVACYPFVTLEDLLGELPPEDRKAG